ncbi:hypothetical protein CKALI_02210 [Corynebacterium kalinowskii]|uniref:Uncharacterized protein n=1 Tax=Corynebacterium kalinowskii TaxID=2675216 RepID=A0A6B8VE50_9CORY|nr:hypothetical protein [Corynebacterium kalinowskii]QGU01339.1 hypothetical protein CKALI_02210 [Corynebacterium kalinowskii]
MADYQLSNLPEETPAKSTSSMSMTAIVLWILVALSAVANAFFQATGHIILGVIMGLLTATCIVLLVRDYLKNRNR